MIDEKYIEREKVLNEASRRGGEQGVSLGDLVALMKETSASKGYLSSLYFAGAEGDHPYFLKNDRVAMGLVSFIAHLPNGHGTTVAYGATVLAS